MPAGPNITLPIPQSLLPLFLLLQVVNSLVAVLIAFDARDRGMARTAAIAWFFAVQIFLPVALLYLLLRNLAGKNPMFNTGIPEKKPRRYCPYCAAPVEGEEKICRGCGRLL